MTRSQLFFDNSDKYFYTDVTFLNANSNCRLLAYLKVFWLATRNFCFAILYSLFQNKQKKTANSLKLYLSIILINSSYFYVVVYLV